MIYLALYRGRKTGNGIKNQLLRLQDRIIRTLTHGKYSHCELAIQLSEHEFECYSASPRDGGVRRKIMDLSPEKWDLIALKNTDDAPKKLTEFFAQTHGAKYDFLGAIGSALGVRESESRWFCSEWCGAVLGLPESWRFTPNDLAAICAIMK